MAIEIKFAKYKFKLPNYRFGWVLIIAIVLISVKLTSSVSAATFIGDVNGDGKVDIVDIGIVIDNYARIPIQKPAADINNDNKVDIIDIGLVIDNYGKSGNATPNPTSTGSVGVPCSSLTGIERKFPCSPLVVGTMPEAVSSGTDKWDTFANILYPGLSNGNGINERFSAVPNPAGPGVVIRNQNYLPDTENHTTVGTGRSLPKGATECSAFRWLWKDSAEFTPKGWSLIWQQQQTGSPIVAVSVDQATNNWFFKTRNGADSGLDITLAPVNFGKWAYFVVCTHIDDAPNGWTKIWFKHDGWPDVSGRAFYERSGHDTFQGETGHNTIGIYAGGDTPAVSYYGYFDRYGRALTPERAVQIAGNH
jgi:hypothetical protein